MSISRAYVVLDCDGITQIRALRLLFDFKPNVCVKQRDIERNFQREIKLKQFFFLIFSLFFIFLNTPVARLE